MWENDKGEKNTTGSVVGELVLKGTLERMGYEFCFIAGFPEEKNKIEKALDYIYAARAKKLLRRGFQGTKWSLLMLSNLPHCLRP